jgi:transposase, IS30 family
MHGKFKQITNVERHQIKVLLDSEFTFFEIAKKLNRAPSTITREIQRNTPKRGRGFGIYNPNRAQIKTEIRHESKHKHRKLTPEIKWAICRWILDDWSPEQITGRAAKDGTSMVSHETIYKFIYKDRRNGGQLYTHLRRRHRQRRKRKNLYDSRGIIQNRIFIDRRPAAANNKSRVGHFEGDTIVGKDHKGAIVSLTEMKTKYQFVCKVQERSANEVQKSIEMLLGKHYPWIKTLTVDNGKEFTNHEQLAKNLNFNVFFCDPYSPWQRGLNENQNGLIRQYIPKSTSFENLMDHDIANIASRLNNRPRKTLGFETPKEALNKYLCKNNFALIN